MILFIYSIVGTIVFNNIDEFDNLSTTMYTMFRASIMDYDVDMMDSSNVGSFLAYGYFISYLIINITLLVNLIVA